MLHELYSCGILYQIGLAFDPADPILKRLGVKVPQDSSTGLTYEYKNALEIILRRLSGWRDSLPEARKAVFFDEKTGKTRSKEELMQLN